MKMYKILIVEDEEIIAFDLKLNLELNGYEVLEPCPSGAEAIAKAKAEKPDLVVMDIVLKGDMDGIEASAEMNELGIPVVFLTATTKTVDGFDCINKPYDFKELLGFIERNLE